MAHLHLTGIVNVQRLLTGTRLASAGLHVIHSKGLMPTSGASSMPARLSSESTISPEEIAICLRDDGSKWLLGSGSFGDVRVTMFCFRCLVPCSERPEQQAELSLHNLHQLLLLLSAEVLVCRCTRAGSTACMMSQ